MNLWCRLWVAGCASLLLSGCLWGPGKFTSDLAMRKDGRFVLDYRGEILLQLPSDLDDRNAPEPWSDKNVRCFSDGRVEIVPPISPANDGSSAKTRACTSAEITKAKTDHDKQLAAQAEKKRKDSEQMAKMFGLPGSDDESNRRFAANLMKYDGWRSVRYRGKGVFDVDYHFEGRLSQDFAFPIMPDSDLIIPFVVIRRRVDGSVMVTAPALTGGSGGPFGARAKAMGMPGGKDGPPSRADGRFTIVTDGEILTNNSEDGPAAHPTGRQIQWVVGPGSTRVPETLIRL